MNNWTLGGRGRLARESNNTGDADDLKRRVENFRREGSCAWRRRTAASTEVQT